MSVQAVFDELNQRGVRLAYKDGEVLSKPEVPDDLMPILKSHKSEIIRELRWRQNVRRLKQTFGAVELNGAELLKSEYNFHLAELRKMESYLDEKKIPSDQREKSIPEFQRLSNKLSDLINAIGDYTEREVNEGFTLSNREV